MQRAKGFLKVIRRGWLDHVEPGDVVNAFALGLVVATAAMLISVL
jgi:hypothetical protein